MGFIWNHADIPRPELLTSMRPDNSGWFISEEGDYSPLWFEGPQLPEEITNTDDIETEDDTEYEIEQDTDSDTTDDEDD